MKIGRKEYGCYDVSGLSIIEMEERQLKHLGYETIIQEGKNGYYSLMAWPKPKVNCIGHIKPIAVNGKKLESY